MYTCICNVHIDVYICWINLSLHSAGFPLPHILQIPGGVGHHLILLKIFSVTFLITLRLKEHIPWSFTCCLFWAMAGGMWDLINSSPWCVLCLVNQSCLTLCHPIDCSPPGSSVHGILQARILEWVAMPSSGGSSQPRDQLQVSRIAGRFFTV